MRKELLAAMLAAAPLAAQTLVVDRALSNRPAAQRIERPGHGFFGDSFRIGAAGEVWMIDSLTVWAIPATGPACGRELGDSIAQITLLGALDNPPVPGQPVCDCHALVTLASVPLDPASSESRNPNVKLSRENGAWRLDFRDVRWSVPGASDVLFSLRAVGRGPAACGAASAWSLAASSAAEGYRLHLLDRKGIPIGLADPAGEPRAINIQVWARQTK